MRKPEVYYLDQEIKSSERWANSLRKVQERFPDATFSGQVMVAKTLKASDCNSVVFDNDTKSIRACIWIDDIPVCYYNTYEPEFRSALRVETLSHKPYEDDQRTVTRMQQLADWVTGYERPR
jgi:hypothetical protein